MPPSLVAALTLAAIIYLLRAPLRQALAVLLGVTLLVPANLLLPASPNGYPSIHRLTLLAFALNLVIKQKRGELPRDVFRPTRIHLALLAYTVVSFVTGVALGSRDVPVISSVFIWVFVVEQLVFFVTVTAAIRAIDDVRWVTWMASALFVLTALVAVGEHFSRTSYARWLFSELSEQAATSGSLQVRGGDVRVRAAVDFALAYAWVATLALPLVIAMGSRAKRRLAVLAPGVVALSIVWSYTRSTYVAAMLGAVALVAASRMDRGVTRLVAAGVIVGSLLVLPGTALQRTFQESDVAGSTQLRSDRLPVVLEAAADRPLRGIGFASLGALDIRGTDSSYLQTYAERGVIGLASLLVLLASALASVWPALRAPPGPDRALGAATFVGMGTGVVGAIFFGQFTISAAHRTFWLLAAIGIVLAERVRTPYRLPIARLASRAWMPAAGVAIGLAVAGLVAGITTVTFRFDTRPIRSQVLSTGSSGFVARLLMDSTCSIIRGVTDQLPDTDADCYPLRFENLRSLTGIGQARLEVRSPEVLNARIRKVLAVTGRHIHGFRAFEVARHRDSKPTWAGTAPVWLGICGLALAASLPPMRLRRRVPS